MLPVRVGYLIPSFLVTLLEFPQNTADRIAEDVHLFRIEDKVKMCTSKLFSSNLLSYEV